MNDVLASSSTSRCSSGIQTAAHNLLKTRLLLANRCGIGGIARPTLGASEAGSLPQRVHPRRFPYRLIQAPEV